MNAMNAIKNKPTHTLASTTDKPTIQGVVDRWHFGTVYEWSAVFHKWVNTNQTTTIKPGDLVPDNVLVFDF